MESPSHFIGWASISTATSGVCLGAAWIAQPLLGSASIIMAAVWPGCSKLASPFPNVIFLPSVVVAAGSASAATMPSTKLPLPDRPGPPAGSESSGNASILTAVISGVPARMSSVCTSVAGDGPPTRTEPSSSRVNVEPPSDFRSTKSTGCHFVPGSSIGSSACHSTRLLASVGRWITSTPIVLPTNRPSGRRNGGGSCPCLRSGMSATATDWPSMRTSNRLADVPGGRVTAIAR